MTKFFIILRESIDHRLPTIDHQLELFFHAQCNVKAIPKKSSGVPASQYFFFCLHATRYRAYTAIQIYGS